ncbi:MAG: metalloprotease PmbA [Gammaproteobacteria bacterium]|nr:metalloprotease PmbA [Gammaproteobacteria bacterium]
MFFDHQKLKTDLTAVIAKSVDGGLSIGADEVEVMVARDQGLEVSVRRGRIENLELSNDFSLSISVLFGKRKGSVSSTNFDDSSIKSLLAKAKDLTLLLEEDPHYGLAPGGLNPKKLVELDLYHPWITEPTDAVAIALAIERAGLSLNEKLLRPDSAEVSTTNSLVGYGNSNGFSAVIPRSRHSMSSVFVAEEKNGMQRDYWYSMARDPEELRQADEVGKEAARRSLAKLNPERPISGVFPVLFAPDCASSLISHFISAVNGSSQFKKASFLLDRIGQKIFPEWLTITENPLEPRSLGGAFFDSDGVQTRNNKFVTDGVLTSYVLSNYSAKRLGLETTGNAGGVRNLTLAGPSSGQKDLLKKIGRGVLVSSLMGQGVNIVNGDYSRGASGFWVENGKISHPIDNFTIAGNLSDMFFGIQALGDDADKRFNVRTPSILVDSMAVAS